MKAVYFFAGNMPAETNLHTVRSSDPSNDYYWTTTKSSQAPQLQKVKNVGFNVISAPYFGKWSHGPRFSDTTQEAYIDLANQANAKGLLILPALEKSENCISGPPFDQYGLGGATAWDICPNVFFDSTTFDQQGLLVNTQAWLDRVIEIVDLLLVNPSAPGNWAQIYDRNGVPRYAINISHSAQRRVAGTETDQSVAYALSLIESAVYQQRGVRIGFTFDTWLDNEDCSNMVANPCYVNVRPGTAPTTRDYMLGIQGFGTELQFFGAAKAYACADKSNRVQGYVVNGVTKYQTNANAYPSVVKQISDGKKSFLKSWIDSGVPVYLDVSPGYDGTKVFAPSNPISDICTTTDPGVLLGDTGRTGSPVFDRWRNAQAEFKGHGVKGVVFNSWNGYTEGMVAEDTIEHGDVERRWLTDFLQADPRLCDVYHYANGVRDYHVFGSICVKYGESAIGGEYGTLGPPVGNAVASTSLSGIYYQPFTQGRIYWNGSKATEVHGAIYNVFAQRGYEGGYGYPTTDELPTPYASFVGTPWLRRYNDFTGGGSIYYNEYGTYAVWGAINQRYIADGRDLGSCGAPLSNEYSYGGGGRLDLERGRIEWYPSTGTRVYCPF